MGNNSCCGYRGDLTEGGRDKEMSWQKQKKEDGVLRFFVVNNHLPKIVLIQAWARGHLARCLAHDMLEFSMRNYTIEPPEVDIEAGKNLVEFVEGQIG